MFSVCFRCVRRRRNRRVHRSNNFCLSHQNRLDIGHKEYMDLGKCTGWSVYDIHPRSRLWHRLAKFACLCDKMRTTHWITTKHGSFIALVMVITWLDFDVFFQGQTLFWPYLRNGWSDWCETKRKWIGWILGTICDLDLWPHSWPWPWMFQGQISK